MMPFLLPARPFTRWSALALALAVMAQLLLVQPSAGAAGRTFHVAPNGDDEGDGTENDPWRTIHLSMGKVEAGDTLLLHGGRYDERIGNVKPLPRGTAASPITMASAPGEEAVIVGGMTLQLGGAHHWIFDGLTFAWSDDLSRNAALVRMVDGVGWQIRNSTIAGNRSYAALRVMAETAGLAADWTIADNCIHTSIPTNGVNNDHNVYVGADSRTGIAPGPGVIERNIISGAPNGANIKLGAGESHLAGTSRVVVRDNVLAAAPHNVVVAWRSHDNRVENNVLFQLPNDSWSQPWYPNIRGLELTGKGNVAVGNAGFADGGVVGSWDSQSPITDKSNTTLSSRPHIEDPCTDLQPWVGGADQLTEDLAERVSGSSRIATAAVLADRTWTSSDHVVIARADDYADALSGSPLAGHLGAPLLLTDRHRLSHETAERIKSLGATTAWLMGGEGALSPTVARELRDRGLTVHRLSGENRYATAAAVMSALPEPSRVFVVEGAHPNPNRGWPDAVALSPLAARTATPVLLTTSDALPEATAEAVRGLADGVDVTIVGGELAVSDAVAAELETTARSGRRAVGRVAGANRFETSAKLADSTVDHGADPSTVWLVTGLNWPDALAAGPAASAAGATMLFVHGKDASQSPTTTAWVRKHVTDNADGSLTVIGGHTAVSDASVLITAKG